MTENLSLSGKRWKLKRSGIPGADITEILRKERGIDDRPEAKLSDPFLFPEMQAAVLRIEHAISHMETVGIFGDYDADGITGTAQLVRYFRRHGLEPVVHLPDRAKEGYGMKIASVDGLKENRRAKIMWLRNII
jgi:single-stranded-DNA-specific exonuclease